MLNEENTQLFIKNLHKQEPKFDGLEETARFAYFAGMIRGLFLSLSNRIINPETFDIDCGECDGNLGVFEFSLSTSNEKGANFIPCSKCTKEMQ